MDGVRVYSSGPIKPQLTCHEPDTVSSDTIPEPEAAVAAAGAHVVGVGVEGQAVNVREVAVEYTQGLMGNTVFV